MPGITDRISVIVRDEDFAPVGNAEVAIDVTAPERRDAAADAGAVESAGRPLCGRGPVRSAGRLPDRRDGDARRRRGSARPSRQVLVGGADLEMSAAAAERSRCCGGWPPTPAAATCAADQAAHAAGAAARIARPRPGTPETARPLAQWVESAGDHRLAGGGMGCCGDGWAWRDADDADARVRR